ncbi:LysE family translocator [Acuticoccus sp. I52.16.1]|uniref:LysE family translocator n=1 Tax=Acuticoccus sp. I52.16.1 TaxID=2928472 RepID=UPI001FD05538|nr:LysE family transporter [Acuticoccus sp. I52.16.1]UOM36320.1 LysE family translocator [Acuticoccus sp. I52.16.1]
MSDHLHLPLILLAALLAMASPGPATLAIAGTAMARGRRAGLTLAAGISTGSLIWSLAAAFGLAALMAAHGWVFEIVRYAGAAYLAVLAVKSARAALSAGALHPRAMSGGPGAVYRKGLALHLTNPKAIFFIGSIYSMGVPRDATPGEFAVVIAALTVQSVLVNTTYATLFSVPAMTRAYVRARRGFEGVFAAGFGLASLKVLTARLS